MGSVGVCLPVVVVGIGVVTVGLRTLLRMFLRIIRGGCGERGWG